MAYSRWVGSYWYTYWRVQSEETENIDTALFCIAGVKSYTAKELRTKLDECLKEIKELAEGDIEELKKYINRFLVDVDRRYS